MKVRIKANCPKCRHEMTIEIPKPPQFGKVVTAEICRICESEWTFLVRRNNVKTEKGKMSVAFDIRGRLESDMDSQEDMIRNAIQAL